MEGRGVTNKSRERTKLYTKNKGKARACRGNRELGDVAKGSPAEVAWGEARVSQTGLNSYI